MRRPVLGKRTARRPPVAETRPLWQRWDKWDHHAQVCALVEDVEDVENFSYTYNLDETGRRHE